MINLSKDEILNNLFPRIRVEDEKMDKRIICKDCGKEFVLTVGEQEWYEEKGFNDPVRCKECRQVRKLKEIE